MPMKMKVTIWDAFVKEKYIIQCRIWLQIIQEHKQEIPRTFKRQLKTTYENVAKYYSNGKSCCSIPIEKIRKFTSHLLGWTLCCRNKKLRQ